MDFGDIKPKALVVAAAAVLLVMGKPLSGSKPFGNVVLRPPQFEHDLFGTVCGTGLNPGPRNWAANVPDCTVGKIFSPQAFLTLPPRLFVEGPYALRFQ